MSVYWFIFNPQTCIINNMKSSETSTAGALHDDCFMIFAHRWIAVQATFSCWFVAAVDFAFSGTGACSLIIRSSNMLRRHAITQKGILDLSIYSWWVVTANNVGFGHLSSHCFHELLARRFVAVQLHDLIGVAKGDIDHVEHENQGVAKCLAFAGEVLNATIKYINSW